MSLPHEWMTMSLKTIHMTWYDKSPKSGRPRERERERIVIYNCVLFGNIRIVIFMPN